MPYVATRTKELLDIFEQHANQNTVVEVDELFQNLTMDVINFYLYGRGDLNYDMVGGRTNLKVCNNYMAKEDMDDSPCLLE